MYFNVAHTDLILLELIYYDRSITQGVCSFRQKTNPLIPDFSMWGNCSL